MSYFMPYFDNLMKKLVLLAKREMGTAKIRFLLTKSISQSFLNFLIWNFLKMSYIIPYFDNLMKNSCVTYEKFASSNLTKSKKLRKIQSQEMLPPWQSKFNWTNLGRFCSLSSQIFLKCLYMWYILMIWRKIEG